MTHVYIVIDPAKGFIYGVYAKYSDAMVVFSTLADDTPGLRISTEPLIQKAAHFPNK
jgi:hypothetical protein